jgi:hypothetical protein
MARKMNARKILIKSPKGIEELETRAHRLGPKLRQALVRVDGAKSLHVLVTEAGAMGAALEMQLGELCARGFVLNADAALAPIADEPLQRPRARPVAPPLKARPADGLSATLPLMPNPELKRVTALKASIRWLLSESMGGARSQEELKLNHCRTIAELEEFLDDSFLTIQAAAGKPKAVQFWREAKTLVKAAA